MADFKGRTFEQVFICDPTDLYYGYTSFDDFFTRRFADVNTDRPVEGGVDDTTIIGAACESVVYNVQRHVQLVNNVFIKDETYSIRQLLFNDPLMEQFVGGTVIQGFLQTAGYHRWHSPVNGIIKKIVDVPGSYFNQAPYTIGNPIPPPESNDLPPYLKSLTYFSHTNTRQLVFIDADNTSIRLLCVIAIGMGEISSCQNTVVDGQKVKRGDELGMFHFGGSSFATVFNGQAEIVIEEKFNTKPRDWHPLKINEKVAHVLVGSDGKASA